MGYYIFFYKMMRGWEIHALSSVSFYHKTPILI